MWKSTSVGCTRQFFTKSFLGDNAAVLARSSGEEPASPRHRASDDSARTRRKILSSTQARTFAITIVLQASGVLCYSRLLGVVAREKSEPAPDDAPEPLREPLLNEEEKADAAEAPGP